MYMYVGVILVLTCLRTLYLYIQIEQHSIFFSHVTGWKISYWKKNFLARRKVPKPIYLPLATCRSNTLIHTSSSSCNLLIFPLSFSAAVLTWVPTGRRIDMWKIGKYFSASSASPGSTRMNSHVGWILSRNLFFIFYQY